MNTGVSERSSGHPTPAELQAFAEGSRDEDVQAHLIYCVECADYVENLDLPREASVRADKTYTYSKVLSALIGSPAEHDPLPGEVWQLEWDGSAMLAMVLRPARDGERIEVVPVTVEDPDAEAGVVRVDALRTRLGTDLFVWAGLRVGVPLGVFATPLERLESELVQNVSAGGPPPSGSWTMALELVDLDAAVRELAAATWAPATANESAALLRETMKAKGLRPSEVAKVVGISVREVREIANGRRAPTEDQAVAIAAYVGMDAEELNRAFRLPDALVHAIERPVHRAAIRARALRDGVSEAAARLALGQEVLLRPARTDRSERDIATWSELLREELDDG